jgi:hypothetical protein
LLLLLDHWLKLPTNLTRVPNHKSFTVVGNGGKEAELAAMLLRLTGPVCDESISEAFRHTHAGSIGLRSVPFEQDLITGDIINGNIVPRTARWGDEVIAFRFELNVDLDPERHVATDTVLPDRFRQSRLFRTIGRLMALKTRQRGIVVHIFDAVWIVARDAGHRLGALKTTTLPQMHDLIRDMIIFRMIDVQRPEEFFQRLSGAIGKWPLTMDNRIAVALSACFNQAFATEF